MFSLKNILFVFLLIYSPINLFANENLISIESEGTIINAYYSHPTQVETFPIMIAFQDYQALTVLTLHEQLEEKVLALGMGLVTLEKQGILGEEIDQKRFDDTQDFDQRVAEHLDFIQQLKQSVPQWNGQLIFLGVEEGGKVATFVAEETSDLIGIILFSAGGGMTVIEEMKWYAGEGKKNKPEEAAFLLEAMDQHFQTMIDQPTSELNFMRRTFKWWAGHLQDNGFQDKLLNLTTPVLYLHGKADYRVPIVSAEMMITILREQNKTHVTPMILDGLSYSFEKVPEEALDTALDWLRSLVGSDS